MPDTAPTPDQPHLPVLVLPEAATHNLAQVLSFVAVLRTGNFQFGAVQLAPYAAPMSPEAMRVAFDRVVGHDATGDESSYVLGAVWQPGTIGERYVRLCQLAAFAVAAAEEVGIELEQTEIGRWNQVKAAVAAEEQAALDDAAGILAQQRGVEEARRPRKLAEVLTDFGDRPYSDKPDHWG